MPVNLWHDSHAWIMQYKRNVNAGARTAYLVSPLLFCKLFTSVLAEHTFIIYLPPTSWSFTTASAIMLRKKYPLYISSTTQQRYFERALERDLGIEDWSFEEPHYIVTTKEMTVTSGDSQHQIWHLASGNWDLGKLIWPRESLFPEFPRFPKLLSVA